MKEYFFAFLLSLILIFSLNWQAINSYFSQDDFFHLNVIFDKKLTDIPSFFLSKQADYAFYRPLSRETYNLVMYRIFGLEALPFHLVNLVLIAIIGLLTFLLTRKLFTSQIVAWFSLSLYSVSSVHNIELYYLGSVQLLLATSFIGISILTYLNKKMVLSIVFFILGLMSHELAITLPGIILLLELFVLKGQRLYAKKTLIKYLPFVLIGLIYFILSSFISNLPQQQEYKPIVNFKSLVNGFGWYIAWSFGLPEMLIDFVRSGLKLNSDFSRWYGNYLSAILPFLTLIISSILIFFLFSWRQFNKRLLVFLSCAFLTSISPFLLFPLHKFIYYLSFSTIWFAIFLAYILSIAWESGHIKKLWVILVAFSLIFLFKQTIDLNSTTYWAAKRSKAAEVLIRDIKVSHLNINKGTLFYLVNDSNYPFIAEQWGGSSRQASYIMSGKDALQLIYKDRSIRVYFEDIDNLPSNIDPSKLVTLVARFPY
jgi:hypothetical protein